MEADPADAEQNTRPYPYPAPYGSIHAPSPPAEVMLTREQSIGLVEVAPPQLETSHDSILASSPSTDTSEEDDTHNARTTQKKREEGDMTMKMIYDSDSARRDE
ncbi:MAG: hypothetical protein Q7T57_04705 [Dehalococcoidales bacterium]|nr:hypothetical protein [Dehalococcoidales bacterium]